MTLAPLKNNRVLSIMLTYCCTAQCKNCGTLSSPKDKTYLPLDMAITAINQAYQQGFKVIVFTGGEATLAKKNLEICIKKASSLGMTVRLVTNAHWATSHSAAQSFISELIELGLNEINFSTGDEHVKYVPIDNVIMAVCESVNMNLTTAVMIENKKDRIITKDLFLSDLRIKEILNSSDLHQLLTIHESPWMPLSSDECIDYPGEIITTDDNVYGRSGCISILSDLNIGADGYITACCGISWRIIPEFCLGHISTKSLSDAQSTAEEDFLKHWLHVEGPENILAWAAKHTPQIKWQDRYAHPCQACLRIYTDDLIKNTINNYYKEKLPDVLFGEWLLYHYE